MPELGEVVLPQHVGHHFRRQFFPHLIAGLCITRVVQQVSRGELIHHPAHFHAGQRAIAHHQLIGDGDKTVRMCPGV